MKYLTTVVLLFLFAACGEKETEPTRQPNEEKPIPVRIAKVERQDIVFPIKTTGTVTSDREAKPAFKTGGVIARMYVEVGDQVKKGQLLASLDLTEINAQVQQAQEAVDKSNRDLQRVENLYADSVATLENVQDATTGLTVAEQNLQMAKFNKNYSEIRSPINGKVIKKLINRGEIVGPGTPAYFILGNSSSDWVLKSGLADRDWARVSIGNQASVQFDAYPGSIYSAKVTRLADTANPGSGTFDVELSIAGTPPRLAAGLVASIEIFPKTFKNQSVIPLDALLETNRSDAKIFTIENNVARAVAVKVAFLYQDKVAIQSGLDGIENVVTDGAAYLSDGAKAEVVQ